MERNRPLTITELRYSDSHSERLKGLKKLTISAVVGGYIFLESMLFIGTSINNYTSHISPEVSQYVVEIYNNHIGPLGKISLLGVWASHEINSWRD